MTLFALWLAGCDPDAWDRYELYFQVDGITSYENGAAVCQVAASARHVVYVHADSSVGNQCWGLSDPRFLAFGRAVPASMFVQQPNVEVPDAFYPVRLDGEGPDLVALDGANGVAWWHAAPFVAADDVADHDLPLLQGVVRPDYAAGSDLVDVAVYGGVAWVAEAKADGTGALHRIELAGAVADEPGASAVIDLPGAPVSVDAGAEGVAVAQSGPDVLALFDPDGAPEGSLPLVAPPDGMKVGDAVAWVSGAQRLYGVDLASRAAPAYVDEEGFDVVDGAARVMHADGPMFFTSSGLESVGMAWDGARPDRPKAVGGFHVGNGTLDIDTEGQVLILAAGSHGMQFWGPHRDWDAAFAEE